MIFLDTHVALWLYAEPARLPASVVAALDAGELFISPMVRLEMALLAEIGRLRHDPDGIVGALTRDLGLEIDTHGWNRAATVAAHLSWTRDPFDRLITAHALAFNAPLCTRDHTIREHYSGAFWGDSAPRG